MGTRQHNAELARRWFTEGWSAGTVEIAEEIFAEDFTLGGRMVGPDGPRQSVLARRATFADLSLTIEHIVAEGELVLTHFAARGRHTGAFQGIPPTGRWIDMRGMVMWRVAGEKVVEDWNCFDLSAVLSQLGQIDKFSGDQSVLS